MSPVWQSKLAMRPAARSASFSARSASSPPCTRTHYLLKAPAVAGPMLTCCCKPIPFIPSLHTALIASASRTGSDDALWSQSNAPPSSLRRKQYSLKEPAVSGPTLLCCNNPMHTIHPQLTHKIQWKSFAAAGPTTNCCCNQTNTNNEHICMQWDQHIISVYTSMFAQFTFRNDSVCANTQIAVASSPPWPTNLKYVWAPVLPCKKMCALSKLHLRMSTVLAQDLFYSDSMRIP